VIGVDENEGRYLANVMREEAGSGDPVISISVERRLTGPGWNVFARKGFLAEWRSGRQVASIDLRPIGGLPGAHNHQNACAAYAAARSLGLAPRQIEAGFASYPGLPHRSQTIAIWRGIRIVNDSKATNVDAAEKALASFPRIRWIAGGRPKEGGIAALRPLFGHIAKAYLIGEAADDFAATLGDTPHTIVGTMESAVVAALAEAEEGDTILLAPACASFDQYDSFEHRGAHFTDLVRARAEAAGETP
jgi:UDP-N-acetylmuramoylalanine--D-glutamate ligase